jgi:uncharacterized protein YehS (DUF1456 family)
MTTNDALRSIRYILKVKEAKLAEIIALGGMKVQASDLENYLKKETDEGYQLCPPKVFAHFLNGLVVFKRGADEKRPPMPIELPITNNQILKKLRVAFELKEEDIVQILKDAGFDVSNSEVGSLFRKPDHKNFRACGDQFLRNFLKGLTLRLHSQSA